MLMGSAIAHIEGTAPVAQAPKGKELKEELNRLAELLQVEVHMRAYGFVGRAVRDLTTSGDRYFLMQIGHDLETVQIKGYKATEVQQAFRDVAIAEQANPNTVLV